MRPIVRNAFATWRETSLALSQAEAALGAQGTQWSGRCEKCCDVFPAVALTLVRLPFGRGEAWQCSACRFNDAR